MSAKQKSPLKRLQEATLVIRKIDELEAQIEALEAENKRLKDELWPMASICMIVI